MSDVIKKDLEAINKEIADLKKKISGKQALKEKTKQKKAQNDIQQSKEKEKELQANESSNFRHLLNYVEFVEVEYETENTEILDTEIHPEI